MEAHARWRRTRDGGARAMPLVAILTALSAARSAAAAPSVRVLLFYTADQRHRGLSPSSLRSVAADPRHSPIWCAFMARAARHVPIH